MIRNANRKHAPAGIGNFTLPINVNEIIPTSNNSTVLRNRT